MPDLFRLLFLFAAFLFFFTGCDEPRVRLPLQDPVVPLPRRWDYRYGESPKTADGRPRFADPKFGDVGWLKTEDPRNPPGRHGRQYLWLRMELPDAKVQDPIFFARGITARYEAYLDGVPVGRTEELPATVHTRIGGYTPLFLRLPASAKSRILVLCVYSDYSRIGLTDPCLYGGRTEIVLYLIKTVASNLLIGFLIFAVSLGSFVIFLAWRKERQILFFGLFSFSAGSYIFVARNAFRYFISNNPPLWWSIELTSLCMLAVFFCCFVMTLFGPGPWRLTKHMARFFAIFYAVSFIAVMIFDVRAIVIMPILQALMLILVIYLSIYFGYTAKKGDSDARVIAFGFMLGALPVIYDLLASLEFVEGGFNSPPFSACVCVITLAIVLIRRLRGLQRRLYDYSAMLQINLAAARQLNLAEQAQVALSQVHDLLPLATSRLFLLPQGGAQLEFIAGRTADGTVLISTHPDEQALVQTALEREQTTWGKRHYPATGPGQKERVATVVAMLLSARSQTLGGLYLELAAGHDDLADQQQELLDELCDQFALSILTGRANRLAGESELVKRRLAEQGALLQSAARMAQGDLAAPIEVHPQSDLASLATALESMRRDLQLKISTLEANNREIHELNDELRRQIDQHSRRVLELALKSEDKRQSRSAHFDPGQRIGEHYQVVKLLGQGTMGSVYEVERITDGRHLAAKVLTPRADKITMTRFAREAQFLSRLTHPNLISIIDVDVTPSGVLFLVMELVRGVALRHHAGRFRDLKFAMPVLKQIAEGLAAIHASNIVHRDLKPANVIVAEQVPGRPPAVKLVDFGISTLARTSSQESTGSQYAAKTLPPQAAPQSPPLSAPLSTDEHLVGPALSPPPHEHITATGIAIGTPMYMAPECTDRTLAAQPLVDVWSFGVIAYELITGGLPFARPPILAASRGETIDITPLSVLCPELRQDLADLITRCLSEIPSQRPSAAALASALA